MASSEGGQITDPEFKKALEALGEVFTGVLNAAVTRSLDTLTANLGPVHS